ncbi:hypothetical protein [Pleurocapsa sp. PCC 7319]|uniref:hypothetical protein n=1 Tax=Pleurocapsa sp. PCC 7319 TaxID=118161 RepID=UPI0003482F64|nr:hypothetical protein [Pleurocapsa sp. PCC 7319]
MTSAPLLSIEIRASEPLESSDPEFDQLPTITIFKDENNNYFLASGFKEIETVILAMISYFNATSHLYSPLFRIQILPGSELDAFLYKVRHESSSRGRL